MKGETEMVKTVEVPVLAELSEAERQRLEQRWEAERVFARRHGLEVEQREGLADSADEDLGREIEELLAQKELLEARAAYAAQLGRRDRFLRERAKAQAGFRRGVLRENLAGEGLTRVFVAWAAANISEFAADVVEVLEGEPPAGFDPELAPDVYGGQIGELGAKVVLRRNELSARAEFRVLQERQSIETTEVE